MKNRARDVYEFHWTRIGPILGHLYIEEITTSELDMFKQQLPRTLGPRSVNHHLTLIRAVLRFMWKREKLSRLPYVPTMKVPIKDKPWYTTAERDRLLDGMFRLQPQWCLFFYLTCRLGLLRGGHEDEEGARDSSHQAGERRARRASRATACDERVRVREPRDGQGVGGDPEDVRSRAAIGQVAQRPLSRHEALFLYERAQATPRRVGHHADLGSQDAHGFRALQHRRR
jgi:hypothetical protein